MQTPTGRRAAFTLIEILLAMAIMAVICGTIYQFTGTTVRVAEVATRVDTREQAFGGLRRLLAAQFAALPASEPRALVGMADDGKQGRWDTLQMLCPAGSAVLTPDARGLYRVALELRELPAGSRHYTLVMSRTGYLDDTEDETSMPSSPRRPADWVRLLDGVRSLEFSYFDPRLNAWVDKWNDPTMNPSLVRVRLATENSGAPYEFVERVPGGGLPRMPANLTVPNVAGMPFNGNVPGLPPGVAGQPGSASAPRGITPPTAPPPGQPPTLPSGLRPPSAPPPMFDPTKPFVAPDTGPDLPPGFR